MAGLMKHFYSDPPTVQPLAGLLPVPCHASDDHHRPSWLSCRLGADTKSPISLAVWERYGWVMAMSKVGPSRWPSWFISHIVSTINIHKTIVIGVFWSNLAIVCGPHIAALSFQHSLHQIHNNYQHVRFVDLGTSVFFAWTGCIDIESCLVLLEGTHMYTYSFVSHATVLRWCPIVLHHLPLLFVMPVQTPPREEALRDSKRIQQENHALAKQWTMRAVANSKICYKLRKWD
jgi:hypothetical protein